MADIFHFDIYALNCTCVACDGPLEVANEEGNRWPFSQAVFIKCARAMWCGESEVGEMSIRNIP